MKVTLAEIIADSVDVYKRRAEEATSDVERSSYLRCAEHALRLADKVKAFEADTDALTHLAEIPEYRGLREERAIRYSNVKQGI
ncbi:hypothetical protein ACE02P_17880 [Shewanella bicestrii]|uniref:hypothetical protein n=1 Tax=Shewanella xiamenensis TaxID=332186 RepID=UPI0021BE6B9A|nr:hypothetical protein [Shewanella xiamenensis]MCT8873792.1 hypothetical protein [Shewanella xiamenensis]